MPSVVETLPTQQVTPGYLGTEQTLDPTTFLSKLTPDVQQRINETIRQSGALGSGESSLWNLGSASGLQPYETVTVLKKQSGAALSDLEQEIYNAVAVRRNASPRYSGTSDNLGTFAWFRQYYAEHPVGSHYRGTFNIGTFIDSTIGVITFGTFPSLDSFFAKLGEGQFNLGKIQLNVPFSGAHGNKYAHDLENFYGMQQLNKTTTPIIDSKIGQIVTTVGAAIAGIIVGARLPGAFGAKAPPVTGGPGPATTTALQSAKLSTAGSLTNVGVRGISSAISVQSYGGVAQAVIQVLGDKIGGTVLALFSGDIGGAVRIFTTNPPGRVGGGSGGGGGGGGGYLPTQQTGQSTMSSVILPLLGLSALGLVLWYFLRKKA